MAQMVFGGNSRQRIINIINIAAPESVLFTVQMLTDYCIISASVHVGAEIGCRASLAAVEIAHGLGQSK